MPDLNVNVFRINRTSKADPVMHFLCFFFVAKKNPSGPMWLMCQIEWHSNLIEKGEKLELGSEGAPEKLHDVQYKREVVQMIQNSNSLYKTEEWQ